MQIISGYQQENSINFKQRLRLYNLSRPAVKKWRVARRTGVFRPDLVDQWVISNLHGKKLWAVDCAGWYFQNYNINVECIESDDIAKIYNSHCRLEYDVLIHRPTYVDKDSMILFKRPWFLRYCKLDNFVNFLNVWAKATMVLELDTVYIQHNHLKFKLLDLVRQQTPLTITAVNRSLWIINQ